MTERAWVEMTVAVYAALIEGRHHFAQASYRDGQWYFMLDRPGQNINGEVYDPVLGAALRRTLLEPVGQWCVFWEPHPTVGGKIRHAALQWIAEHRPAVRWIPDRPIGKALQHGAAAPFFRACRTRRVILVGPEHLAEQTLFPVAEHIIAPKAVAWQHEERLSQAVLVAAHKPDDLVLICAGHASNLIIHRLWPKLRDRATLMDLGATFDPFVGVMSRGEFRDLPTATLEANRP